MSIRLIVTGGPKSSFLPRKTLLPGIPSVFKYYVVPYINDHISQTFIKPLHVTDLKVKM